MIRSIDKMLFLVLATGLLLAPALARADDAQPATGNVSSQAETGANARLHTFLKQDSALFTAMEMARPVALAKAHPFRSQACAPDDQSCDPRDRDQRSRAAQEMRDRHSCRD